MIELEGAWTDGESTYYIDSEYWDDQALVDYSNSLNEAFTQNPDDESPTANFYNKVVWTEPALDTFAYCFVSSNEETLALAQSEATTANPFDLETGCNGGAWTSVQVSEVAQARVAR